MFGGNTSGPISGVGFLGALLLASDGNLYGVGDANGQDLLYSVKLDGSNFTGLLPRLHRS